MTVAALPARRVISACRLTLQEIDDDRNSIGLLLAADWRRNKWWRVYLWFMPLQKIVDTTLPTYFLDIMHQHRAVDHGIADALLKLARAVNEDDPSMRIEVSATDFSAIRNHYAPEGGKKQ